MVVHCPALPMLLSQGVCRAQRTERDQQGGGVEWVVESQSRETHQKSREGKRKGEITKR